MGWDASFSERAKNGNLTVGIIGLGNRGMVLLKMFEWLIQNNKAEIVALCDLKEEKTQKATDFVSKHQSKNAICVKEKD